MIDKEISEKVLTIGPYRNDGKGGVAVVLNNLAPYYHPFYFIPSTRGKNPFVMGWYFATAILKLLYYILFKRIKIVHIHGASYGSFVRKMILINIAHLFGTKVIYHIHGAEYELFYKKYNKKDIIKNTLDKADVLIVLSEKWKAFFSTITNPDKIEIVNNMINRPDSIRRTAKRSDRPVAFLFLGEIGERKGVYDLLDVITENRQQWDGKIVICIGGNGETEKLQKLIQKHDLHSIVQFEGWVSGEKKSQLLSECAVFILPSYNEGLPVSILEAMSYGMPVISATVGGIPEVVKDGVNGFLITPGDKRQLEEAISYMIENKTERERMGNVSKEIVGQFYPENVIPHLNTIYKRLL